MKAINYDRKHQRDQEYVNNKIQEHTNDLANMHKSELKVCEFKFQSPLEQENITLKPTPINPPNEFMIRKTKNGGPMRRHNISRGPAFKTAG